MCESWLRKKAGGQPYALLIEANAQQKTSKSSLWLAHRVIAALGPPVVTIEIAENSDIQTDRNPYVRAVSAGARCIVHLNDAVYSGSQLYGILKQLGQYAAAQKKIRIPVYVAAAYATKLAQERLQRIKNTRNNFFRLVHVYYAYTLPENPLTKNNFKQFGNRVRFAPTMSIMPHKVPDEVSFGLNIMPKNVFKSYDYLNSLYASIRNTTPRETYKQVSPKTAKSNLKRFIRRGIQKKNGR